MKKKTFAFTLGARVSSTKDPSAHGTVVELVGRDIPLYLVRWDNTPNQLLLAFEREISNRSSHVQNRA